MVEDPVLHYLGAKQPTVLEDQWVVFIGDKACSRDDLVSTLENPVVRVLVKCAGKIIQVELTQICAIQVLHHLLNKLVRITIEQLAKTSQVILAGPAQYYPVWIHKIRSVKCNGQDVRSIWGYRGAGGVTWRLVPVPWLRKDCHQNRWRCNSCQ